MTLEQQLIRDEGCKLLPYQDTVGLWTIGVGHLLGKTCPPQYVNGITQQQADEWLEEDIADKANQLINYNWFANLDDVRKNAIINMAFNLGVNGLLHFPSMIHYLSIDDWDNAATEMLDSVWAGQVHNRANRLAQQITTGIEQ